METTALKVGHRYRLSNGQTATIESIRGRGRNRKVRTNVPVGERTGLARFYSKINHFAALVVRDEGPVAVTNND